MKFNTVLFLGFFILAQASTDHVTAQRVVIPLNGRWAVEEGVQPEVIPTVYNHTVPVPGLTHQSKPAFPDVDKYETRDYVLTMVKNGVLPSTERCDSLGRTPQKRNYFWYQKNFHRTRQKKCSHPDHQQSSIRYSCVAQWNKNRRTHRMFHLRTI